MCKTAMLINLCEYSIIHSDIITSIRISWIQEIAKTARTEMTAIGPENETVLDQLVQEMKSMNAKIDQTAEEVTNIKAAIPAHQHNPIFPQPPISNRCFSIPN